MSRTTIDVGIDLGTANSVIGVVERGEVTIVKNSITQSDVTPSAVMIDRRGTVTVGQNAYQEIEASPENAVGQFKRWMGSGTHNTFHFQAANRRMTAAELSAEVLKVLRADAAERFGEITAAVVTVPAMFPIPACEDTKAAARLAGIETSPLLQEPVAAAIAYGYKTDDLSGNLLVFDLGGGTFDTSVLTSREGRLIVLGHSGDNKLGGKNYDQALVDFLIARLSEQYDTSALRRGHSPARHAIARLTLLSEDAKRHLSRRETYDVSIRNLGPEFDHIDTVIPLSRADVERCTGHLTRRCIDITEKLLADLKLSKSAVQSALLVGGGTLVPSVRKAVELTFERTDHRIDPMTVVGIGAALFASTQKISSSQAVSLGGSQTRVKVAYSPVATDLDADVGIVVSPPAPGNTVLITRTDRGWSSGAIPVPADGHLMTTVALRAKRVNSFEVQLRDGRGNVVPTNEATFAITHGLVNAKATTSTALSVALVDNQVEVIIPKGTPLPAKGTQRLVAAHTVKAGDPESVLNIYGLEGDNRRADRNLKIAKLQLRGEELNRSIPAGEAIEITYKLDESKTLSVEVLVPSLGEVKTMTYEWERPEFNTEDIDIELAKERKRIVEIRRAVPGALPETVDRLVEEVNAEKQAAGSDPDTAQKAAQRILELKQQVDQASADYEWDILTAKLTAYADDCTQLTNELGTPADRDECKRLRERADAAIRTREIANLRAVVPEIVSLHWRILFAQNDFWKAQFENMAAQTTFVDPLRAERLKEEGLRALKRNDFAALQTIVWDLYSLLPTWQQGKLDLRFADAGLTKGQGVSH